MTDLTHLPTQVVQPCGPGEELLGGTVAFYLTYQDQIETWAKYVKTFRDRMSDWYLDVLAPKAQLDGWTRSSDHSQLMFAPQGKPEEITVGLMWDKTDATKPYVGVLAQPGAGPRLLAALKGTLPSGFRRLSDELPAWRYTTPPKGQAPWWSDLESHRDSLLAEINNVVSTFGPAIIEATSPSIQGAGVKAEGA